MAGFFLAPYLYGLFWRGATPASAWAGAITGLVFSVAASLYYKLDPGVMPTIGSLAMLIPLAVMPVVSLFTSPLPEDHLEMVFGKAQSGKKAKLQLKTADKFSS